MNQYKIESDVKQNAIEKVKDYLMDELDTDAGEFEVEFLIDFVLKQVGGQVYNQGLHDAQQLFNEKFEQITDGIYELER